MAKNNEHYSNYRDEKGRFIPGMKHPPLSAETRARMSIARRSRKRHPMQGRKHTEATILKMRLVKLGKVHSEVMREKLRQRMLGTFGSKSFAWKGGLTALNKKVRNRPQYQVWRTAIFERDDYTCVLCLKRGVYLEADHIIPLATIIATVKREYGEKNLYENVLAYPFVWDVSNGRTLCLDCHKNTDTFANRLNSNYGQIH